MSTKPSTYVPETQLVRDKTSCDLTPSSPTPGLLSLSNSISNSSSSPPEPTTPPRSRTRYPDIGRVPLHRRGNSKTYERLEDLLREAGYKETRVFTPETERSSDARESQENRLSMRDGMDAVVGFFAGLLPGAMTSKTYLEPPPESAGSNGPLRLTIPQQDYSPPASPLISQRQVIGGYDLTEPTTPTTMTSSLESLGEPTSRSNRHYDFRVKNAASTVNPHAPRTYHSQRPPPPPRTTSQYSLASQQMHKQSSRSSLHHQAVQHQYSNIVSPRPSRYVRHMTSTSSMLPRPNSTPAHVNRPAVFVNDYDSTSSSSTHTPRAKPGGHDSDQPPLPPSWLESVARAVLFGGTGAYIGGPSNNLISHESFTGHSPAKAQILRSTRSSLSQLSPRRARNHRQPMNRRSGLFDATNSPTTPTPGRSAFLVPPPLFSQIERGRSGRSEGEVSRTKVTCRSAPGSRNGSPTRSGHDGGRERRRNREMNSRKKEKGRLPSLARTQVEGDVWERGRNETHTRRNNANRYLTGWGADVDSEAGSSATSDEEDDGELDLARILVPPKRQHSIRSLRKHLACEVGPGPSAYTSLKNYAATRTGSTGRRAGREMNVAIGGKDWDGKRHQEEEEWGGGWVRRGGAGGKNREAEDDDVDSFVGFFGEGRTGLVGNTSKSRNRLGFNGAWGLMGGNSS